MEIKNTLPSLEIQATLKVSLLRQRPDPVLPLAVRQTFLCAYPSLGPGAFAEGDSMLPFTS